MNEKELKQLKEKLEEGLELINKALEGEEKEDDKKETKGEMVTRRTTI